MVIFCPTTHKHSFADENAALRGLHKVRKARKGRGQRERGYYLCPFCGLWHLTSYPSRPAHD